MSSLKLLNNTLHPFRLPLLLLVLSYSISAFADDPGITKVRLIQQTDTVYLFEADVPSNILSAISPPVFPERFRLMDFNYADQSGWITLRVTIVTSGPPLSRDDEIVLPWLRNGVDFTVQWMDGTTYKGLFNRTLNGIHIPMNEVMPTAKTTREVLQEGFLLGLNHFGFKLIHILLVFTLAWNFSRRKTLKLLLWYSLGQAMSMVVVELKVLALDLLFSELLIIWGIFMIAYSAVYNKKIKYAGIMLLACGFIHGLAYGHEISATGLGSIQWIQSLFAFNLAIDLGHFLLGSLFILVVPYLKKLTRRERTGAIVIGSLSVLLACIVLVENIAIGKTQILEFGDKSKTVNIPVGTQPNTGQVQRGAGLMTTPVMVYLSIEPYEVRQEVLVEVKEAIRFLNLEYLSQVIPIAEQEKVKGSLGDLVLDKSSIAIASEYMKPADVITNFVRLSRGGVYIREAPIEESLDESIISITLIYDIESFPDSLHFDWLLFGESVEIVETSIADPHGAFTINLDAENHSIKWESRLSGFHLPAVGPIVIERYPLPLVSIILFLWIIVILLYLFARKKTVQLKSWMLMVLVIAFVIYPMVRMKPAAPFMPEWKPSEERTSIIFNDLLSNIYRAFDRRNESDVYDRLEMSVTNNQLTDIYMQNRQSMALENRGGARAKVDDVNIQEVFDIKRDKNGGYVADARWTVRGSVNHFGHTHYRQNQYRALVSFGVYDENWKVSNIEILDTRRLY